MTLSKKLFGGPCKSLTGRIRPTASYNQRCNYGFQSLASDGAKIGMWRLFRMGIRLVGFVHDELICELPGDRAHLLAPETARVLCDAMEEVTHAVTVTGEYTISREWEKP